MKYYYADYSVVGLINGRWMRFATEADYKEAYAETQASNFFPNAMRNGGTQRSPQ